GTAAATGSNTTAATITASSSAPQNLPVTLTASLAGNSAVYQTFTATVPVVSANPTVNVSCPSNLYVGQPGQCTATVSTVNSMDVTNSWTITNAVTGTSGGAVSGATGEFDPSATVTPTTTYGNKTVDLHTCLTLYPTMCTDATATIVAQANTITATVTPPAQLYSENPSVVQGVASADYGTLTYAWSVPNAATLSSVSPTGSYATATSITPPGGIDSQIITLTATLTNDPTTSQSFSVT